MIRAARLVPSGDGGQFARVAHRTCPMRWHTARPLTRRARQRTAFAGRNRRTGRERVPFLLLAMRQPCAPRPKQAPEPRRQAGRGRRRSARARAPQRNSRMRAAPRRNSRIAPPRRNRPRSRAGRAAADERPHAARRAEKKTFAKERAHAGRRRSSRRPGPKKAGRPPRRRHPPAGGAQRLHPAALSRPALPPAGSAAAPAAAS